ncbi:HNH endonuclease [Chromatium okenii]|uniref:HNH endonuclease n=1 Tax=Chromatium okenii TaxID=61644 RepID=UPI0026EF8C2A|nr:HNH endonuclease [Chromatium okenii]MBV5309274.1 HNH endonuclease [Chromatium okenii]
MITQERLHELFLIHEDGELIRRVSTSPKNKAGNMAGCVDCGYKRVVVDGKNYRVHRLIWMMTHGKFPVDMIDHINGNKLDNRILNLREANQQQNQQNSIKARANNKLGLIGVSRHKKCKRFRADIMISGKTKYLGLFETPEEAHQAYLTAKREYHDFCTI